MVGALSGKTLAVTMENRRQPVVVLSAFVFSEFRSFAVCRHSGGFTRAPAHHYASAKKQQVLDCL